MKKLLRLVWPLMAGNTNVVPDATLPKPPEFCDTLTGATPGVRARSWVKLRPFKGRSTTCFEVTAAPSSAVALWTNSPAASTGHRLLDGPDLHGDISRGGLVHFQVEIGNLGGLETW